MSANLLDKLTATFGAPRAFDGRYCVWVSDGPHDIRDMASRLKTSPSAVVDCLPDFKPVKRGRAALEAEEVQ